MISCFIDFLLCISGLSQSNSERQSLFESEWAVSWTVEHNESKKLVFEGIHNAQS